MSVWRRLRGERRAAKTWSRAACSASAKTTSSAMEARMRASSAFTARAMRWARERTRCSVARSAVARASSRRRWRSTTALPRAQAAYTQPPRPTHKACSIGEVAPAVRSQAMAKTMASTGAKESGPARSPQARVISDRKVTTATRATVRASEPSARPTSIVTRAAAAAAGSTRGSTRCGGLGTSGRLAQTAPPTAASPAVSPNSAPTTRCVTDTPRATLRPLRWAASSRFRNFT